MAAHHIAERTKRDSDVKHDGEASLAASDAAFDGLSIYERKALLVNRELDSHGMGKYQWWIWSLCGFGYVQHHPASSFSYA